MLEKKTIKELTSSKLREIIIHRAKFCKEYTGQGIIFNRPFDYKDLQAVADYLIFMFDITKEELK